MLNLIQAAYVPAAAAYLILALLFGLWMNRPRPEKRTYHPDR